MSARRVVIACLFVSMGVAHPVAAGGIRGGGSGSPDTGGAAQISTWVIGSINGGVSKPAGVSSCTPWTVFDGATFEAPGATDPRVINPSTGELSTIYYRTCDGKLQFVYVGPTTPGDIARVAFEQVSSKVPRPEPAFSPPIDKMIVNFETWLGITPQQPVTATAGIPGLTATVTAQPTDIEWTTGTQVDGDIAMIRCKPWGSTTFAKDGCVWTPAYPSVPKVTGTDDLRYHGTITIVWQVSWQATNGASGTLEDLRTTTPVAMTVQEIQIIGG